MSIKLSDKTAREALPPAKGNRIDYDSEETGFGLRVTAGGARSWILSYRVNGMQRRLTLGPFPLLNSTQARQKARKLKADILANSVDPLQEKQAARQAGTVEAMARDFDLEHIAGRRPKTQDQYRHLLRTIILPAIGRMRRPDEVTRSDIIRMHRATVAKGKAVTANRALAVASAMFSWAVETGRVASNPCANIKNLRAPEDARVRYLAPQELERLTAVLNAWPDQQAAAAIRLLMLSGARKSEVAGMKWADLQGNHWTKPARSVKQARTHSVPLSAPALQILAELRESAAPGEVYVFPSSTLPGKPIVRLSQIFQKMARKAQLTDFHLHDLRHNFASTLATSGASLHLVGSLLGHSSPAVTARYAHLADDARQAGVDHVGRMMEAALSGKAPGEVVPLKRRDSTR